MTATVALVDPESVLEEDRASGQSGRGPRRTAAALVALGAVLVTGLLAYSAIVGNGEPAAQVLADQADTTADVEGSEVLTDEERTSLPDAVAADEALGRQTMGGPDGEPIGYVVVAETHDLSVSSGLSFTLPMPMYDVETDAPIGFWFSSVGFVTLDEYEQPGFDVEQVVLERYGREALEGYREARARYGE